MSVSLTCSNTDVKAKLLVTVALKQHLRTAILNSSKEITPDQVRSTFDDLCRACSIPLPSTFPANPPAREREPVLAEHRSIRPRAVHPRAFSASARSTRAGPADAAVSAADAELAGGRERHRPSAVGRIFRRPDTCTAACCGPSRHCAKGAGPGRRQGSASASPSLLPPGPAVQPEGAVSPSCRPPGPAPAGPRRRWGRGGASGGPAGRKTGRVTRHASPGPHPARCRVCACRLLAVTPATKRCDRVGHWGLQAVRNGGTQSARRKSV